MAAIIRNPVDWGADQVKRAASHAESVAHSLHGTETGAQARHPEVRRLEVNDLREVLAKGLADFGVYRTDVVFLCVIYPVVGIVLARFAFDFNMLPLLLPVTFGFLLLGPVAAIGLYEMSRRREQGVEAGWSDAFGLVRSPSFFTILTLGFVLLAVFLLWLAAAQVIYMVTLGPEPPASVMAFMGDVFTTGAGWAMIVVGLGVGFLFAVLVLAISVVSFPLLLDRDVGLGVAIWTSVRVAVANPRTIALWGLTVAGGLALGSIPLFLGLIVVMPVLGHATWHLYRKAVAP